MEIIVCTHQSAIFREYQQLAKRFAPHLSLRHCGQWGEIHMPLPDAQEDLARYAEKQAVHLQCPILVEEAVLVVPILQERFFSPLSVEEQSFARLKLLRALQDKSSFERSAYLECTLFYADPFGKTLKAKGLCEGMLLEEEQGNGFGYDSIFRKHSYNQTLAQLPAHIKEALSERSKAFQRLSLWLESASLCNKKAGV